MNNDYRSSMATSTQRISDLADLRGFTILVLEDDPDTLELLRAILSACGARVLLADSIHHARGYLQILRPDLVVSDLALPSEDGLAFLRWLRGQRDPDVARSEEHTSELQSQFHLVCRLLLE